MNAILSMGVGEWWQLAGWTMLHFLWLGTLVGLAAMVCRIVLRGASADARYVMALVSLATLAVLPVGIATWLVAQLPSGQWTVAEALPADEIIELNVAASTPMAPPISTAPGSAEGFLANDVIVVPSAQPITSTLTNPRQSRGLTDVLAVLDMCVPHLPWLWLIGTPITFALLATGIIGAERLRRGSRTIDDGPIVEACARLRQPLGVSRRVAVAICERIAAPVLLGIVRPIILLPPVALTGWSPDEIEMVLLHELAHVRRWDNLVNLVQRLIESLLFFHPAVWLVSAWVRREREACCDAVVVERTHRPHAYAELLVAFAAQMPRGALLHPATSSAMAAGPLRKRIRRILQLEDDPMLVSGKSFALVLAGLVVAATLVVFYQPTLGQAQESTTEDTESTEKTNPSRDESTNAHQTESPDKARIAGLEKALQDKISLVVVLFNDNRGYHRRHLRPIYEKMAREGKTIYLFGININPASDEAKRFGVGKKPTLIIFRDGKEMARLKDIENAEQLNEFVAATLGRAEKPMGKFPALEDQRLADLAYKRLGLEMEPIDEEDLKRVHALGYEGGLKVASGTAGLPGRSEMIRAGDILVGLHVWPTTSMQALVEVLNRDDLTELNPLKFYVVYRTTTGDPNKPTVLDDVRTGRVSIKIGGGFGGSERGLFRNSATGAQPAPTDRYTSPNSAPRLMVGASVTSIASDKANLRYDGKTFDQWRDLWRNELSTERRIEAIDALAAFGAAGYGPEAAKAILDVVKQYDWSVISNSPASKLKSQAILAFTGVNDATCIAVGDWQPVLAEAIRSGDHRVTMFAQYVFRDVNLSSEASIVQLIELSRDDNLKSVRPAILQRLQRIHLYQHDPRIQQRMVEALSEDQAVAVIALATLYPMAGDQSGMLYGGEMMGMAGGFHRPGEMSRTLPADIEYRPELIDILERSVRQDGPYAAVVLDVLAQLGPKARPAVPRLLPLIFETEGPTAAKLALAVRAIAGSDQAVTEYLNGVIEKAASPEKVKRAEAILRGLERMRKQESQQGFGPYFRSRRGQMGPTSGRGGMEGEMESFGPFEMESGVENATQ